MYNACVIAQRHHQLVNCFMCLFRGRLCAVEQFHLPSFEMRLYRVIQPLCYKSQCNYVVPVHMHCIRVVNLQKGVSIFIVVLFYIILKVSLYNHSSSLPIDYPNMVFSRISQKSSRFFLFWLILSNPSQKHVELLKRLIILDQANY